MNLSRYEQETHISFNAEDNTAEICTADPTIIRKLEKLCAEHPDHYKLKYKNDDYTAYTVSNKKMFYPHKPRTGREYTEEEKIAAAARLKAAREKRDIDA